MKTNRSVQKSQDRKKHIKFSQMYGIRSLFSSIAMAWSIMNSCYKVVGSIRKWKSYAPIVRRNSLETHRIVEKPITPKPPWALVPAAFLVFPKLKTPITGKRFITIADIKEKSKQELLAVPKIAFQKFFEYWKKYWHKCINFSDFSETLRVNKMAMKSFSKKSIIRSRL